MADKPSFPSTKEETLALLFLQKQDLGRITPKELVEKYDETYKMICGEIPEPPPRRLATSGVRIG